MENVNTFNNKMFSVFLQGEDENRADQVDTNHGREAVRGGDRGEVGGGRPHRLAQLHSPGAVPP